jgi:peptidoglycan/LPS O-acetylase OafA/YrhL
MIGAVAARSAAQPVAARFGWLDGVKGISILWVVFFHTFMTHETRYPWVLDAGYFSTFMQRCQPDSWLQSVGCGLGSLFVAVTGLGFHAVSVFLVASGFGLSYAMRPDAPQQNWWRWYGRRLVRLFPMYWLAHLIYLVSPLIARPEPLDYRFLLSALGDRVYPIDSIYFYANPAWWYFGLLLQFYLVFPLLHTLLRKTGVAGLLLCAGLFTLLSRALLLGGLPVSALYLQGGFFGARLWEFALGMAIGSLARSQPQHIEDSLFARRTLVAGAALYGLALWSTANTWSYAFTDALVGTGLFIILAHLARAMGRLRRTAALVAYVGSYSYGLYLLHQPYVIYFGAHMQGVGTEAYIAWAVPVIAMLTVCSIALERGVNRLTQRL